MFDLLQPDPVSDTGSMSMDYIDEDPNPEPCRCTTPPAPPDPWPLHSWRWAWEQLPIAWPHFPSAPEW